MYSTYIVPYLFQLLIALLIWGLQESRKYQKVARDSRVVMYRKYREGELPDIQIKYSEIIRPLQALAQVSTQ